MNEALATKLAEKVREMPDFPKPGLVYRDITPIVQDAVLFSEVIDELARHAEAVRPELICGVEARGYIFGAALAYRRGLGFLPIRWEGKLPQDRLSADFELEYGFDALEVHGDALKGGTRVLIVDDLLGTGKTIDKCAELVRQAGGDVAGVAVVVEVAALAGRKVLEDLNLKSLCVL